MVRGLGTLPQHRIPFYALAPHQAHRQFDVATGFCRIIAGAMKTSSCQYVPPASRTSAMDVIFTAEELSATLAKP